MARGYQKGAVKAFYAGGMDGPSIIHSNPRKYIWSYIAGISNDNPCNGSHKVLTVLVLLIWVVPLIFCWIKLLLRV